MVGSAALVPRHHVDDRDLLVIIRGLRRDRDVIVRSRLRRGTGRTVPLEGCERCSDELGGDLLG